jgi:two-component system chemotaxis sensor kinase CheA
MDLILRCIDFLRGCMQKLRVGSPLGSSPDLIEELNRLQAETKTRRVDPHAVSRYGLNDEPAPAVKLAAGIDYLVSVRFEAGMPLVDLKAELVVARLTDLGAIRDLKPQRDRFETLSQSSLLDILIHSESSADELRKALRIDGIDAIDIQGGVREFPPPVVTTPEPAPIPKPTPLPIPIPAREEIEEVAPQAISTLDPVDAKAKVVETVRVDIERLDALMNLAGELVVNKARFVQIVRQMAPSFRKSSIASRTRNFSEMMRRAMQLMRSHFAERSDEESIRWLESAHEYEAELEAIEEQSRLWDDSRRGFGQITEAIDQLSRVSKSLQRGVLETRMVPVGPLFNRFKRVVRDISNELQKKVNLEIHGEKTELDKRMIDELGDPLVHLIRNAIDHGLETPETRLNRGKPEEGTLHLEASHSGNNVFIRVRDDGDGINAAKIRKRLIEKEILPEAMALALSDRDAIEYIWHPGFSTAEKVSDISGRGVGMDIVKTRIAELNGTIDIDTEPGVGTTITIRLPLTLAIIRSLLFGVKQGIFAVPLDNVREIVSVPLPQIISIHGKKTFEVRNEFIPLVDIDEVFEWNVTDSTYRNTRSSKNGTETKRVEVVLMQTANRIMGLKVDELHGGQDIVIKSLAENFVSIRGLSGASILGDGSVCLLLDVGAVMDGRKAEIRT